MASVSDLFFFFQKNPSLKKKLFSFLRGMKVREHWLVQVNLFYKDTKSKKKEKIFLRGRGTGGGGGVKRVGEGGLT